MSDETFYDEDNPDAGVTMLDLREEIDRKALFSIEKIVARFEKNFITRREASTGINAVFDAVQGLVSSEVGEVLNTVLSEIDKSEKADKFPMVFGHKGNVVILRPDMFSLTLNTIMVNAGGGKAEKAEPFENETMLLKAAVTKAMTFSKNGAVRL